MAGDQTKVVAGRNIIVYTAPWATTNDIPADTILWGTAWGAPFTDKGFTRDGVRFRLQVTRQNVNVDQVVDPVLRIPTGRDLSMETTLAQVSASNLSDASGQGTVTTSAGHDDVDITGTIVDNYLTVGFDVQNPGDLKAIRMVGWKGIINAALDMRFNVTDAALIQFNAGLVPDTSTTPTRIAKFRDVN
jgi:hypothetical protein